MAGETIILESCEYCDSFLSFYPTVAVILNVEADHLDYFKDLADVEKSFRAFADKVPENGLIIAQRHVHLTPRDAERFGVRDGEVLGLKCLTDRPAVLMDTVARVSDKFATYVHLDYDEANACGWAKGDRGRLV